MAENNDDSRDDRDLAGQVLEDYAAWYGRVLRAAYYPDEEDPEKAGHPPGSFDHWYNKVMEDVGDNAALEQLRTTYDELVAAAYEILGECRTEKPAISSFDALRENFDAFFLRMRRFDFERLSGDFGIDPLTELRSKKVMLNELSKEMERRSRQGMPFTLVLVSIDHYDSLQHKADEQDLRDIIRKSADVLSKCMRTVDDAYRLSDHEFLVSLKHTDMNGGIRFADRVKQYLVEEDVRYNYGSKKIPLILSYCCGEPLPGDDLEGMISYLQSDLKEHYKGPGTSIFYEDTAPIERYVKAIQNE
jgi:diguanylate cyclase (GGDEF)-like protein